MKHQNIIQFVFLVLAAFFISAFVGSVIHEGTHILVMQAGGSRLEKIVIIPGIKLYPHLAQVKWSGYIAGVSLTECPSQFFRGLSLVMGSASNAIASYLLLGLDRIFYISGLWPEALDFCWRRLF
ncbi:MAG: hypothetical protein ACYSSP_02640 [Planctomycetota bacterium]|jgi:hypothetical protein